MSNHKRYIYIYTYELQKMLIHLLPSGVKINGAMWRLKPSIIKFSSDQEATKIMQSLSDDGDLLFNYENIMKL